MFGWLTWMSLGKLLPFLLIFLNSVAEMTQKNQRLLKASYCSRQLQMYGKPSRRKPERSGDKKKERRERKTYAEKQGTVWTETEMKAAGETKQELHRSSLQNKRLSVERPKAKRGSSSSQPATGGWKEKSRRRPMYCTLQGRKPAQWGKAKEDKL